MAMASARSRGERTAYRRHRPMSPPSSSSSSSYGLIAVAWALALASITAAESVPGAAVYFPMAFEDCRGGGPLPDVGAVPIGGLRLNGTSPAALCHPAGGAGLVNSNTAYDTWTRGTLVYSLDTFTGLNLGGSRNATIEIWFRPAALTMDDTRAQAIFAVSRPVATGEQFVVGLVQQQHPTLQSLGWLLVSGGGASLTTASRPVLLSAAGSAIHVAITVSAEPTASSGTCSSNCVLFRTLYYVNGALTGSAITISEPDRPYWDASGRLYLFSAPLSDRMPSAMQPFSNRSWQGTIHAFAIYNRTLAAVEVSQSYQARLANNRPLALDVDSHVQRDGVVGPRYDTPEYFLELVPVLELPIVPLPARDADEDPAHPNYNATAPPAPHLIVLTSLPDKGALYFLNGSPITAVPTPVPRSAPPPGSSFAFATDTAYLRYRPLWREVSAPHVYTTFTFAAVDGLTDLPSHPATVRVVVTPMPHDFPTALANATATTVPGVPVVIPLNGTASGGAVIEEAVVARLPAQGELYQVHPANGSAALAAGPIVLPDDGSSSSSSSSPGVALWSMAVAYVYTGPEHDVLLAEDGALATDGFAFRVRDNVTALSLPANVSVSVRSALGAVPALEPPSVVEGTTTRVVVHATDALREYQLQQDDAAEPPPQPRALRFEITALPRHGALLHPATHEPMDAPGVILHGHEEPDGSYAATATITYQATPGFFDWPRVAWDGGALEPRDDEEAAEAAGGEVEEGFSFRIVSCDDDGACATSLPVTQGVRVVNRNDPTGVEGPASSEFTVMALGTLGSGSSNGGTAAGGQQQQQQQQQEAEEQQQPPQQPPQQPDLVTVTGWAIHDPDRGVDPVVVRLEAQHGILRLSPAHLSLADFTSTRFCHAAGANWTCEGSGEDRRMVFVASPQNLRLLLGGLEYQCARAHVRDTVVLTIFDGEAEEPAVAGADPPVEVMSTSTSGGGAGDGAGGRALCLPRTAFNNTADRAAGCLVTTARFTVAVGGSALLTALGSSRASPSVRDVPICLWLALGALGGYVLLTTLTGVWQKRQRQVRVGVDGSGVKGG